MFPKSKKDKDLNFEQREQREQYEYARRRIKQKKNLLRHFIIFIAGAIVFIVLDAFLNVGHKQLGENWYVWAILIWLFIFLVHILNVFIFNTFMGKEWEDRQLEKLKVRQAEKMAELQRKVNAELPLPEKEERINPDLNNPLPPQEL
ncbi:MAG TPA: 2TM domain-containing protein [Flavobacteriaceae bacterium]|nr:2TM domain-containing protein [Flavobacteriaceae bacterium]